MRPAPPKPIATGAERVHINMMPAARQDETAVCSAKISQGSPNVKYGGASVQMLDIQPEIPEWMTTTAQVMAIGGTIVAIGAGAAAAFVAGGTCALVGFAGETIGALAFGYVGAEAGGAIGEQIGGERGRIIGEFVGGFAGGLFGQRLGGRITRGHPVDVATGELFTEATDFTLPGPLPLAFTRAWVSSSSETGATGDLGAKWANVLGQRLLHVPTLKAFALRMEDGRIALFQVPEPGKPSVNAIERLLLETDGSRLWVRDYNGISRHFAPNPSTPGGFLLSGFSDRNENRITIERDRLGLLARMTGSAGHVLEFHHDDHGRLTQIDAPHPTTEGARIALMRYGYDGAGNLAHATIDAEGNALRYAYLGGQMVGETRKGGLHYTFEWDESHTRVTCTWGRSASGAMDRLNYAAFTYDEGHKCTIVADAEGHETRYFHDGAGHVTLETDPLGRERRMSYDKAGNLLRREEPSGAAVENAFDGVGRLEKGVTVEGFTFSQVPLNVPLADPRFGLMARVAESQPGTTTFSYDVRGNLMAETGPTGAETRYLRNERGLLVAVTDEIGPVWRGRYSGGGLLVAEGADAMLRVFEHDRLGRVVRERHLGGPDVAITRDLLGNPVLIDEGEGRHTRLAYDAEGNVVQHVTAEGAETRWAFDGIKHPVRRVEPTGATTTYTYDTEFLPLRVTNPEGEHFVMEYDPAGQLLRKVAFDGRETVLEYADTGALVAWTEAGRRTYAYHGAGMLSEARVATWDSELTARYTYDAFNRRISKTVRTRRDAANDGADWEGRETFTRFFWAGDDLIGESTGPDAAPCERLYIYRPGQWVPLFLVENGKPYLYDTDHLGTPQALFDASGAMVWSARYRAFGRAQVMEPGGLVQPLRAPGQYHDAETGLHYNRNRYLHTELGRYTQPDPIGLLGGENLYGYPPNPANFIDFFGLTPLNQGGYSLYHITNRAGEVVYVGITNDPAVRRSGHTGTGRLGRGYQLNVVERNLTYAQARGYEQADIRHYGIRDTSRIGQPYRAGDPNRVWSYAEDRTDARAQAFQEHERQRTAGYGGCG